MRPVLVAALVVPMFAFAAPNPAPPPGQPAADPAVRAQRQAEKRAKFVDKMRLRRVLEISEALDLSEAEALKMSETMARFDGQREALLQQMMESGQVLRRAAKGDSSAFGQVDAATGKWVEAKSAMLALDRQIYDALAQGLSPDKRARLALAFGGAGREKGRLGARPGARP